MKTSSLNLSLLGIALSAAGCGGGTSIGRTHIPPTISVSPQPASIPINGSVKFTAVATSDGFDTVTWTVGVVEGVDLGSVSNATGSSTVYTAPSAPPIYDITKTPPSSQGTTGVTATDGPDDYATSGASFIITAPSVTTFISPAAATVALRAEQGFYAYAVGNLNNAITFEVNGLVGGSSTIGFIDNSLYPGLFTAPETMPPSGNSVTVTARSQADPTKSSSAIITLK